MPEMLAGKLSVYYITLNCLPNFLFIVKFPIASITVPKLIEISFPVKVTSSEKPLTLTFITANLLSSS